MGPVWGTIAKAHLLHRWAYLTGAYPDLRSALSAVPKRALAGYDHADVVPVSMEIMCSVKDIDYPVLFWLDRAIRERGEGRLRILDAGGHTGTKFIAFRSHIDLSEVDWVVYDLPAMVAAGRRLAASNRLDGHLSFIDNLGDGAGCDVLLCSGLLQYLDIAFSDLVGRLPRRPETILLNKVAVRDGPSVVTLQRIGLAYVPYQIRSEGEFENELAGLDYEILDRWELAALSHRIASHPELGRSRSLGFMLRSKRTRPGAEDHRADQVAARMGGVEPAH